MAFGCFQVGKVAEQGLWELSSWTWAPHTCPRSCSGCDSSSIDPIISGLSKTEQATITLSVHVVPSTVDGHVSLGWVTQLATAEHCKRHTIHPWRLHMTTPNPTLRSWKLTYTSRPSPRTGSNVPASQSLHTRAPFLYPDYSTAHPCRKSLLQSGV